MKIVMITRGFIKKLLSTCLAAIILISTIPTAFADTDIFSFVPGGGEDRPTVEDDADILGEFTENGYINRYFTFKMPSIDSESNEIADIKNNEEVKQYLKENEFYMIYKSEEKSISVYRLDCYGEASSESRFLELLSKNASSYPWQNLENDEKTAFEIEDANIELKYGSGSYSLFEEFSLPALQPIDETAPEVICFLCGDYVLVISNYSSFEGEFYYDFAGRIERDVESWRDISSVNILNGYAIGVKKDGTVVTAGIIPHCTEEIRDWKDVKKIVGKSDLCGLTTTGKILACISDMETVGTYEEIKELYAQRQTEVLKYDEPDNIIDITYGPYGLPTCLTAEGEIYSLYGEALVNENINSSDFLPDGEKLEKIYQDPYFYYHEFAWGEYLFVSNKGNFYGWCQDPEADRMTLKKYDISNVSNVFLHADTCYSSVEAMYAITKSGKVAAFKVDMNADDIYVKEEINEYSNIVSAVLTDDFLYLNGSSPYRPFLILVDSVGNVHTAEPAHNSFEDFEGEIVSKKPCVYESAYEMSQWKDIVSIEYNHYYDDLMQYFIGIKKDGTAVCSFQQNYWDLYEGVASAWADDDATDVPYKQLDEPIENCILISINCECTDTEKGEATFWVAGENKNWTKITQHYSCDDYDADGTWYLDSPMDVYYIKVTFDNYKPFYDDYLKNVDLEINEAITQTDFYDD